MVNHDLYKYLSLKIPVDMEREFEARTESFKEYIFHHRTKMAAGSLFLELLLEGFSFELHGKGVCKGYIGVRTGRRKGDYHLSCL